MSSNATEIPGPISSSQSVARSAGVTSIAVLASRITGLVREIALAHFFGATAAYDAYILGFRIPNLTRDLFAEGALSSAFVPTFVDALHKKSKEDAAHLANLVATAIIIVVGLLCLAGMIFAPQMVDLLAPGFRQLEGKHELAVRLTRIMCPFLLLVALAAQSMGILNACNQFALPALSSSLFNVGSLAVGLSLGLVAGPYLGIPPIEGMAWGVLTGGFIQLGSQVPALVRSGFVYRPAIDWSHPGLRQILRLMGPAILGSAAVQINVMVNTSFASEINGGMSWLGYAFRLMQLPLGLFGVAIGGATLPAISRSAVTTPASKAVSSSSRVSTAAPVFGSGLVGRVESARPDAGQREVRAKTRRLRRSASLRFASGAPRRASQTRPDLRKPRTAGRLVEAALQLLRPAERVVQVDRRFGRAEEQVAVRPQHPGYAAEDRLLRVHVEVDHHVPQEH